MNRTCVLLLQLGTPDSPSTRDVRRYLSEFLNDPRVIDLPFLLRKILVNGIIVPFRAPKSAKIYKELWDKSDGISPLMTHTENVKDLLQKKYDSEHLTIEFAMRYQNPSMDSVMEKIRKENYDHIIILPLFPHYASASGGSAIDKALKIIKEWWVLPKISVINQFWDNEGYINSIVERSKAFDLTSYDHILFSYHGLPNRHVDKVYEGSDLCSDQPCEDEINEKNKLCYKATAYATTRLLAHKMNIEPKNYTVCFQSRLDKKWLTPFSDQVVEKWAEKGAKKLLVFSPAFVADCLETIIEIGDEYKELFIEKGGQKLDYVPSLNSNDSWVRCIVNIIKGI